MLIVVGLVVLAVLPALAAENPPSLEPLQGKWMVAKTHREGQRYSQIIEVKKDKLTFQVLGEEGRVRLFAKGTIQTERAGAFNVLTLTDIQGGRSADELEPVDDTRALVYTLRDGQLFLASNFDKERSNEKPTVETYVRVEATKEATAGSGGGESRLMGTWKVELSFGDNNFDYGLRISKGDGRLEATLISPRSGEHKCKSVSFKDGELVIEVDREIEGNQVTFIYKGKLTEDGLAGTTVVKGREDQFNGRWKASK